MHIQHDGIESTWKIRIYGKHYAVIFIWESKELMQSACSSYGSDEGTLGLAHSGNYIIKNSISKIPPKFGEIHLVRKKYGAALVAHEIQHMVNYFSNAKGWNINVHDEKIAMLAYRMTKDFWNGHYAVYNQ